MNLIRDRALLCGALLAGLVAGVLPAAPAWAAEGGTLDSTFGTAGKVITDIGGGIDRARAVAIQPDGKIVVAGDSSKDNEDGGFTVFRYNPSGSLDTTFGVNGRAQIAFGYYNAPNAVAIQPDGKIVLAGYSDGGTVFYTYFALARFTASGAPDVTFGAGGKVLTSFDNEVVVPRYDAANAVALQPDGKIVAAGYGERRGTSGLALARYNRNGTLDRTFGTGGKVVADFGGVRSANAVTVQPDGKIVTAGSGQRGNNGDVALARFHPNGTLDPTLSTGGVVLTDFGGGAGFDSETANAVTLQRDGKILIAGQSDPGGGADNFALARYNANGSLDTTFGTGGKVLTDVSGPGGTDAANAVAIQRDGKVIAAGYAETNSYDFALVRYTATGSPDTTFGTGGTVLTDFGGGPSHDYDYASGVAVQSDGKILAAGETESGGSYGNVALARYLP